MALKNISLNINLIFIVIILFFIPHFIKSDTKINHYLLNYIGLVPLHYDVKIELDFTRNVFFGECNITINITHKMAHINIPSVNFGIFKIDLIINDNNKIHVPRYSFINETYIYIDFTNTSTNILLPGTYILHMIYFGNIFDNMFLGYEEEISEKVLTETGVEVIRAQQIFPCWDEPVFRSTFHISIMHHTSFKALSNMGINKEEYIDESDKMWTHFHKSPFMSSQRLTIVITTFTNIFQQHPSRHPSRHFAYIKIWCKKNIERNIEFAQFIIEHVLYFLHAKSQTKIQKIDYVAISDVQHSNFETLGLILHREEDIIYVNRLDSIARKIKVASLVARQVISVWYDYVSWPIEGFATYHAPHILEKLPSISYIHDLFVVQVLQESLRFDIPSYNYNSTLHNSNDSDVTINKISLNYIKPSVIWYVQHTLIEDMWNDIRIYADKYYQSNAVKTDDFLNILTFHFSQLHALQYKEHIRQYIDIWKKKNYYPVVYATLNATNDTMSFSYLSSYYIDENKEQLAAFVTFMIIQRDITNTSKTPLLLLPQNKIILINITAMYNLSDKNYCVIVNVNQTGYYRVNYNSEGWFRLAQCLSKNYTINVLNHAQVIDDAFHFLIHHRINITMFWNIVSFLSENANYVTWYPMIKAFEYMACVYSLSISITENMERILNGVLQIIGYNEKLKESDLTKCLREEVAKWACIIDAAQCRATATSQLIEHLKNPIVVNNRFTWNEWKYCKGLMSANHFVCTYTWKKWTTSNSTILEYITCCKDSAFITFYLNQTIGLTENYKDFPQEKKKHINIVLLTIAKHVKDVIVFDYILNCLKNKQFVLSKNRQIDIVAILIISITHTHSPQQLRIIENFVTIYLKDEWLIDAVKNKTTKQKFQYKKQIAKYGYLAVHDNK